MEALTFRSAEAQVELVEVRRIEPEMIRGKTMRELEGKAARD
jgi:hypothetical protein